MGDPPWITHTCAYPTWMARGCRLAAGRALSTTHSVLHGASGTGHLVQRQRGERERESAEMLRKTRRPGRSLQGIDRRIKKGKEKILGEELEERDKAENVSLEAG